MFAVKDTGENSGDTYKPSSNVGAYILVLLKGPKAGFLMRRFAKSANVAQTFFYLTTVF